jgi:hypothetical protein
LRTDPAGLLVGYQGVGGMLIARLALAAVMAAAGIGAHVGAVPTPVTSASASRLVDQTFKQTDAECVPLVNRSEALASPWRFSCTLPTAWAKIDVRVAGDGRSLAVLPRALHQTAATESPAERLTARRIGLSYVSHVVCVHEHGRRFSCDAHYQESNYEVALQMAVELSRYGPEIGGCRLGGFEAGTLSIYACQHLSWDVNHMTTMVQGMQEPPVIQEQAVAEDPR